VIKYEDNTKMNIKFSDKKKVPSGGDALILPVIKGVKLPEFRAVDRSLDGMLSDVMKKRPSLADSGGAEVVHAKGKDLPGIIMLVGLGEKDKIDNEVIRKAGGAAYSSIIGYKPKQVLLFANDLTGHKLDYITFAEGFMLRNYSFDRYKGEKEGAGIKELIIQKKPSKGDLRSTEHLAGIVDSVHMTRDLVNTPSNDLVPSSIADIARKMSGGKLKVKVLGVKEIQKLGMNAFYSVSKGSKEEPKFIIMEYSGKRGPKIAVVGKAITFDSGGISLKPSAGMEKMKYDMAGGAVVLGIIKAAGSLKLPVNLVGIIPACENLPSGSASKPGDVVKTLDGKTVEIINTDAEGRLILADAISYTKKLRPKVIINIATLTGACSVALGDEAIAMMGNDQEYMDILKEASDRTGEKVWQMPLYDEYKEYIKSEVADIKNSGGRSGSLVTAGYFLKEFAGDTPWIHLDIASTAWTDKGKPYTPKGASGVGVRLLIDMVTEVSK
jgi:leucyl aminopeptidase